MAIDTINRELTASHRGPGKPECVNPFIVHAAR
jgi:hypothetical protein